MTISTRRHRTTALLGLAAVAATGALALPGGASAASAPDAASAAAASVPACTSADLGVHYRATDAAMSHRYGAIVLTNTSGHACRTGGFGGLSYVGGGDGTQVGAPATRDTTGGAAHEIVMKPGQHAVSQVSAAVADVYPRRTCRPEHVDGFRVYVPNSTRSTYVKHPTTGCANPKVHLLSHRAFR